MTFLYKPQHAKQLTLPGRNSRELIGNNGQTENISLRYVVIKPPRQTDKKRKAHFHPNCEECIYVLSGNGITHSEGKAYKVQTGDSIVIARGEHHYTENMGTKDLILLCFFPSKNVEIIELDD